MHLSCFDSADGQSNVKIRDNLEQKTSLGVHGQFLRARFSVSHPYRHVSLPMEYCCALPIVGLPTSPDVFFDIQFLRGQTL